MKLKPEEVYQFMVLGILATVAIGSMFLPLKPNDMVLGAIITLAVGLPTSAAIKKPPNN